MCGKLKITCTADCNEYRRLVWNYKLCKPVICAQCPMNYAWAKKNVNFISILKWYSLKVYKIP